MVSNLFQKSHGARTGVFFRGKLVDPERGGGVCLVLPAAVHVLDVLVVFVILVLALD